MDLCKRKISKRDLNFNKLHVCGLNVFFKEYNYIYHIKIVLDNSKHRCHVYSSLDVLVPKMTINKVIGLHVYTKKKVYNSRFIDELPLLHT